MVRTDWLAVNQVSSEVGESEMKVALTGPMYSGKSTLAKYLETNANFWLMNYTDSLKDMGVRALQAAGISITLDDILTNKKRYRPFLQELGTAVGFDDGYGVQQCIDAWHDAGEPEHVVFDNVRFASQYAQLIPHGFVLVKLHLSPEEISRRARSKGVSADEIRKLMEHQAESGVKSDLWINAERPVEQIAETLLRMGGIPTPKVELALEKFLTEKGDVRYRV